MNTIEQRRLYLEEVGPVVNEFKEKVIREFNMIGNPECEIQRRGIGIAFEFGEDIRRSDDEIQYLLKDDKIVGLVVVRRTSFNNAEVLMITTEERYPNVQKSIIR